MDSIADQFLAPAIGTFGILLTTVQAMMAGSKTRYAVLDDNGKKVLPHPYKPWTQSGDKSTQNGARVPTPDTHCRPRRPVYRPFHRPASGLLCLTACTPPRVRLCPRAGIDDAWRAERTYQNCLVS